MSSRDSKVLSGKPPRYIRAHRHWNDLLAVQRAVLNLVKSGLPLAEGLRQLSEDDVPRRLRYAFYWLHRDIAEGNSLARAMGNQSHLFPRFCIDVVQAGEESGRLLETLENLVARLEKGEALRQRSARYGYYLGYLLVSECVIMSGLVAFVLPQYGQIKASFGVRSTNWFDMLMGIPGIEILFLLPMALPFIWVVLQYSALQNGLTYRLWSHIVGNVPFVGAVFRKRHLGESCALIGLLLDAGTPLPDALRAAAEASQLWPLKKLFSLMADQVEAGQSLTVILQRNGRGVPRSMAAVLSVSEQSGNLPDGFRQLAQFYEVTSERNSHLIVEIGGPAVLCLIGLVVSAFYLSVFLWIVELPVLFM